MRQRPYKIFWLLLALLFAGQSLLPVAALAEISVRCVGTPAASSPCAHMVIPLTDKEALSSRLSALPCCRDMVSCRSMVMGNDRNDPAPPRRATLISAPKCLITVSSLSATSAANVPGVHRWLLHSAPALAPPAVRPVAVRLGHAAVYPISSLSFALSPRLLTASQGLRAPPAA